MSEIEQEGEWVVSLDDRKKAIFLANLGHALTIAGRDSYTVQGEGLDHPEQLRKVNEVQHRVLAALRQILTDKPNIEFQRSIAHWVLHHADVDLRGQMAWAWRTSKEQMQ